MSDLFPTLPDDWEATRATLHAYAHGVGAIARVHGIAHPKWWHISLKVNPGGLRTESIPLPDGGTVDLRMDLRHHHVVLEASSGDSTTISMTEGLTGTEFGDRVAAAASALGLAGDYDRAKFENDEPRDYSPAAAETFFDALVNVETTMQRHRATLGSNVGPIQVWPHGFDLAFEWYGTRVEVHEEEGEKNEIPSQLNFGFYPAGRALLLLKSMALREGCLDGGSAAIRRQVDDGGLRGVDPLLRPTGRRSGGGRQASGIRQGRARRGRTDAARVNTSRAR